MRTYPIMLDLRGRLVVVVGGGPVGLRKVRSLAAAGARVRLVAERLAGGVAAAGVEVLGEAYRSEHVAGALLVFAATDDARLNARIAADARAAGGLVNAVDQPADCDFFAAATVRRGDVVVAVGTGGNSPSLAAVLRKRLAGQVDEAVGQFAAILGELRQQLKALEPNTARRGRIMRALSAEAVFAAFRAGGPEAVRARFDALVKGS